LERDRGSEKPEGIILFWRSLVYPNILASTSIRFVSASDVRGAGYGLWCMADSRCLSDGEHPHTSRENHLPFPA
jgi:hypothetical protein